MKSLKKYAAVLVLVLSAGAFVYYLKTHPQLLTQLSALSIFNVVLLLGLYLLFTVSLVFILLACLRLCKKVIPGPEAILLTIYSSIVNFFGPLQSGPGFRAAYLKTKHQVGLKAFAAASLGYYGFFAFFSAVFLLGGGKLWRPLAIFLLGCVALGLLLWYRPPRQLAFVREISIKNGLYLAGATLLQVMLVATIYFVELRIVDSHVSIGQAICYTGAANFALFVSLTPGAIGVRESFLLFSQRLHHIPSNTVIAASVIDRAIYVAFLGLLFVLALGFHAKDRLGVKKDSPKAS